MGILLEYNHFFKHMEGNRRERKLVDQFDVSKS